MENIVVDLPLQAKTAVITGSSSGIGLAVARRLAVAGANIVLSGRNEVRGKAAELALQEAGVHARYVSLDVTSEESVRRLMDAAVAEFGSLDILVNNAGPTGSELGIGKLHELPAEMFDRTMRIGAYGPFYCCKHAIPHMITAGGGAVVNISAIAAIRALPHFGGYAIAKSILEALGRQVANDYAAAGIRCNTLLVGTVRPGAEDVSTLPDSFDAVPLDLRIAQTTMLGSVGRYSDVASAVLFLVTPESRYITGASLPVDGGALGKLQYPDYLDAMSKVGKQVESGHPRDL